MFWIRRGPNFRDGDNILKFAVRPTQISAGSGVYVSASIGGDATIENRPPVGYTTQSGTISPGKSTVLVWQLGNARTPSTDPASRVITNDLPYTPQPMEQLSINITTGATTWTVNNVPTTQGGNGLNAIPVADRPQTTACCRC